MSLITVPSAFKARRIVWRLIRPSQVNRSGYTGRRVVTSNPWHGRWEADIDLVELEPSDAMAVRAFLAALDGPINTFRLPVVNETQTSATIITSGTHVAGAQTLATTGWPPSAVGLLAGQYFTINDQLCILTANVNANGAGAATLTFKCPLREGVPPGTSVIVGIPTCLVAMTDDTNEWTAESGPTHTMSLKVEEVF